VIIHVYAICWNEEKMLPHFFKHYNDIADQFFIYDNGSTDNSLLMLSAHPKVSVDKFEVVGYSFVRTAQGIFNQFWKNSKGKADWVIVCDIDEHLYHPNLRSYLQQCTSNGITLIEPLGYEMFSDSFPNTDKPLHETIRRGARAPLFDKPQIFNPNEIQEINFGLGRHDAFPVGNVSKPSNKEVLLLHYKYLGFDYLNARYTTLKQGLRPEDIQLQFGYHYLWDEKRKLEEFESLKSRAVKIL
jgi:hypothetical protein